MNNQKTTIQKLAALLCLLIFTVNFSFGQSITFDNAPPVGSGSTAVGVSGGIIFNFTTNRPIVIENFKVSSSTGTNTATIWYNTTKINGQPVIANMNPAGGWNSLGSASHSGSGNTGIATIPVNCNLNMNPGDTFGFFIQFSGGNVFSNTSAVPPTYTNGTVTIIADSSCAFTRNATAWFGPVRQFMGGVIYRLALKGANDASISQLMSSRKFCGNNQDLRVKVANIGSNAINNVNINWSVDGVVQTPFNLVTLLDTLNHPTNKNDTTITLGNIAYTPNTPKTIHVWTSMPNGIQDTITNNDSIRVVLQPGLSGTYTLGTGASDFATFTAAVNKLDSFGKCGAITFNVTPGVSLTQQPLTISNYDSITFQKFGVGVNPIVYGVRGNSTADAIFKIAGSKNIIFDGIDLADSASNPSNTERMEFGYAVINSSPTTGSLNNTIRNCRITLNRTNTATFGIVQSTTATAGGTAATSLSGANHNNRYENIKIENSYKGIGLIGTPAFPDSNCIVTSTGGDTTIIGANTANDIGNGTALVYGISAADQRNVEISKCLVRNLTHTSTSTTQGIFIDNGSTTVDYGTARVWGNTVHSLNRITTTSTTGTIHGIRIDVSTTASARVWNNVVYNINSVSTPASASANQIVRGISHGTTTGTGNAEYYFNSVSINTPGLNSTSAAFWKGGTGAAIVRNNIFSNTSPAQSGVSKHYGAYLSAGSITASNNIYWSPNANGFVGFATSDRTTLASFAAATSGVAPADGNEQGSANANPNFASATNLNFSAATPAVNSGLPISTPISITTDISGVLRNTTTPSIGAYETTQTLFDSAAPVISNISIINSANPIIRATITDNSNAAVAGSVQLWYRLGTSGTFTAVVPDSIPTGTINGVYRWSNAFNSLATGTYQFYIAARDLNNPGANIAVNPIQSNAFTGFAGSDPVNYANNPDAGVNVRTFVKTNTLAGGTYQVGATSAPYFKLTDVANAINSSELTGNVIFELQGNYDGTVGETFPIVINQLNTLGGNWSVVIRPALGVTNRETSGYPASATPIIHLNGADRITLDGRPGGVGSSNEWTIRSKRTASTTTSPCIQLSNGAQRNLITNLKLESDNTATTSGAILVSTTSTSDGNSFNRITNNTISDRSDSTGVLAIGIYSAGTTGFTNDSNIVSGNQIFNWITTGVHVTSTANGSNWRITDNHFYMTAPRTTAQTSIRFEAGAQASGIRISNNFIGGSAVNAGGAAWTNSVNGVWRGIVCAASLSDSVQIHNNTIQNINLTGGTGTYAGIEMTGALASIRNNTIGHSSTANSIQTSQLGTIISLWLNNANNQALIDNNTIANITSSGNTTAVGYNGIRITTGVTTAPLIIRNNQIFNLSAANPTTASTTASMIGILSLYAGTQQTIERNTIFNLSNSANAATNVFGINVSNASGVGTINANHVYNLNNTSATAASQIVGIHLDLGNTWSVTNNMVALGTNVDSLAIITGIQDKTAGTNHTIAFNSVLISGTALSSGATVSHAYRRTTGANTNIRNNIFQNIRSGGTANYAIANTNASPATGWMANYNALNAANSAQLGLWNTTATDFASWKTTSLHDTASINTTASFVSSTDLHLAAPTLGDFAFSGRPISGISTDFDGQTRHASYPYMGADENLAFPLPVDLTLFTAKAFEQSAVLDWQTASEVNNSHFEIERTTNGKEFETIGYVKGNGSTITSHSYQYLDKDAAKIGATLFYRLKQVDMDGKVDYSKVEVVNFNKSRENLTLILAPNPSVNFTNLSIQGAANEPVEIEIFDMQGKKVLAQNSQLGEQDHTIKINHTEELQSGIYYVQVKLKGQSFTLKMIKQPQ